MTRSHPAADAGAARRVAVAALVLVAAGIGGLAAPAAGAAAGAAVPALPRLAIDRAGVTVSGVSSGGYMATQFQVAHSALIRGAGIFAAGPWYCARGSMARALGACLGGAGDVPDARELVELARRAAAAGRIDDVRALADDRVWVFHGARDDTVAKPVADALVEFYRAFVPAANVAYVTDVPAAHGVPTPATGAACGVTQAPFLNACGYDGVGRMLAYLYGALRPSAKAGPARAFDQSAYDPRGVLARTGFLYVPSACAQGASCRLHVALHGCRQGAELVGGAFVEGAGYDGWAESNRIVVLYPQAKRSLWLPFNPQGCWDWWGYTGDDYATKAGAQVAAVRAMVRAITGF